MSKQSISTFSVELIAIKCSIYVCFVLLIIFVCKSLLHTLFGTIFFAVRMCYFIPLLCRKRFPSDDRPASSRTAASSKSAMPNKKGTSVKLVNCYSMCFKI